MAVIIFFILHWYLSLFCQTFFLHRYAAHQMFTMSKFWEKFFYIFTFICQGSSYLSPYGYGILHRLHHANADTENDPHSPKYDKNMFAMMWKTKVVYHSILIGEKKVDDKFFKNYVPKWESFEAIAHSRGMRLVWMLLYTAFYYYFATELWMWALLPLHFIMGPLHGAIINWFAHTIGYVNFKVNDTSKNMLPFDFLMFGEGYHNNHHKYGTRPNFGGIRWHELDPAYPIILILDFLHIIRIKKNNPDPY